MNNTQFRDQMDTAAAREVAATAARWGMPISQVVRNKINNNTDFGRDAAEDIRNPIVY